MKHLKIYEYYKNNIPQVGDYVICKDNYNYDEDYYKFINENIGRIVRITAVNSIIEYDIIPPIKVLEYGFYEEKNIPLWLKDLNYKILNNKYTNLTHSLNQNLEYYSPNKEDVEAYIQTKKYNL